MKREDVGGHKFVVLGAARSGIAAAHLLRRHGVDALVADEKPAEKATAVIAELDTLGIPSVWGETAAACLEGRTAVVLSPGIPRSHPIVLGAIRRGMPVIGEIELAHAFMPPGAKLVAITGTNGKTTTTAWIAHLLNESGIRAVLGGNIGDAWANRVDSPENAAPGTVFVIEVSSFQLESIEDFHPDVAILTNLAPDHLDRYPGFGAYADAKRSILRNLGPTDAFIWNSDNPASVSFPAGTSSRVFAFSALGDHGLPGAVMQGDMLALRGENGTLVEMIPSGDLPVPGHHNLENALAAALAAWLAGAPPDGIRRGLRSFPGVEHRIEFSGRRADGVEFFNDSKATNLDSLEKALRSFRRPVVLIAGGRDKNSDYSGLNELVRARVRRLVTLGEAAPLIEAAWRPLVATERAASMDDAVRRASAAAREGDVVLLSPACASYDMYNNFEERGRDFKACVAGLLAVSAG